MLKVGELEERLTALEAALDPARRPLPASAGQPTRWNVSKPARAQHQTMGRRVA
ncbi:MAG TPA: hypothetical protein VM347_04400 [Nonomuraea sp.]|nr:hypothetical protein [Nonomuraea sp.]